jgi:hypothetical protein
MGDSQKLERERVHGPRKTKEPAHPDAAGW